MIINLKEQEIHKALAEFVSNQGIDLTNKEVKVSLTAGRTANGFTAQIEISQKTVEKSEINGGDETKASQPAIAPTFSFGGEE